MNEDHIKIQEMINNNPHHCENCGKQIFLKKSTIEKHIRRKEPICLCKSCMYIRTCQRIYGCPNAFQAESIKLKSAETNLRKTGFVNPMKNPEVIKSRESKYLSETGYNNPSQNPEVKQSKVETSRKNWGTDHHFQNRSKLSDMIDNNLCKYGVDNVSKLDTVKNAKKMSANRVYNVPENVFQADTVKEKSVNTIRANYGVDNVSQSEVIKTQKRTTMLSHFDESGKSDLDTVTINKHGNPVTLVRNVGNKFEQRVFNEISKLLRPNMSIGSMLNNEEYMRPWIIYNHQWDMVVFKDRLPFIFIDCDGSYFHNLFEHSKSGVKRDTPESRIHQLNNDLKRRMLIPDECHLVIVYERRNVRDTTREDECINHIKSIINSTTSDHDNLYFMDIFQTDFRFDKLLLTSLMWSMFNSEHMFTVHDCGRSYECTTSSWIFKT